MSGSSLEAKDHGIEYFGLAQSLSATKTTLSGDPKRMLIGENDHRWDKDSIFNSEGGCFARLIDLSKIG